MIFQRWLSNIFMELFNSIHDLRYALPTVVETLIIVTLILAIVVATWIIVILMIVLFGEYKIVSIYCFFMSGFFIFLWTFFKGRNSDVYVIDYTAASMASIDQNKSHRQRGSSDSTSRNIIRHLRNLIMNVRPPVSSFQNSA